MSEEPRYPNTEGKALDAQVKELKDYIVNLQRYVRYALNNIDGRNMTKGARFLLGKVGEIDIKVEQTENGLKTVVGEVDKVETDVQNIKLYKTYVRYSANPDGTNMTETPEEDTAYMGICTVKSETAPEDPAKYDWVAFKGAAGKGISSIKEQYYLSTSKTTQTGGSWISTMPSWSSGTYLWTRHKIAYTNPSSTEYTDPKCDSSWEAMYEAKTEIDQTINSVSIKYYDSAGNETTFKLSDGALDLSFLKGQIDDAERTATNFISLRSDGGIEVGNRSGGNWTGYRTQMLASEFNILNAAGTVLASYGAQDIYLGKNNTNAKIHFCNGEAVLKYNSDEDHMEINTPDGLIIEGGAIIRREYPSPNGVYNFKSGLDAYDSHVKLLSEIYVNGNRSAGSSITLSGNIMTLDADGYIFAGASIETDGDLYVGGNLFQKNGSGGNVAVLTMLNSRTDISLGWGSYDSGEGSTYVLGGEHVYLRSGTDAIYMFPCYKNSPAPCAVVVGDSGGGDPNVHPAATGGRGYLGTINYKWKSVYATTGTIQTSDRRLKRNISDNYDKYEEMILSLRPVTFDFIDLDDGIERTGFIAQEVLAVMEQCGIDAQKTLFVIDDKIDPDSALGKMVGDDHVLGMNYEQFIVPIISVVQKLEKRIEKLENQTA